LSIFPSSVRDPGNCSKSQPSSKKIKQLLANHAANSSPNIPPQVFGVPSNGVDIIAVENSKSLCRNGYHLGEIL
jgi:hypothetical protein